MLFGGLQTSADTVEYVLSSAWFGVVVNFAMTIPHHSSLRNKGKPNQEFRACRIAAVQ